VAESVPTTLRCSLNPDRQTYTLSITAPAMTLAELVITREDRERVAERLRNSGISVVEETIGDLKFKIRSDFTIVDIPKRGLVISPLFITGALFPDFNA